MTNTIKRWLRGVVAAAMCAATAGVASAQTDSLAVDRYYMRTVQFGIGGSNVYDTYLSPQEYTGVEMRVMRETMRMTSMAHGRISVQNLFQGNVNYNDNRVENNNEFSGTVRWNYGWHYHLPVAPGFKFLVGGLLDGSMGYIYNLRNGNNPASARASVNVDASAMAIWRTHIRRYPLALRYQVNVPVAGFIFSPNYGQSYYEIFSLGNLSGVVRFASLHNQPSMWQMLSVDMPVGRLKMRLSYVGDMQQSKVNGLRTHIYSHIIMVGFVKHLIRVDHRKLSTLPAAAVGVY